MAYFTFYGKVLQNWAPSVEDPKDDLNDSADCLTIFQYLFPPTIRLPSGDLYIDPFVQKGRGEVPRFAGCIEHSEVAMPLIREI